MLTIVNYYIHERKINFYLTLQIAMFLVLIDGSRESANYTCLTEVLAKFKRDQGRKCEHQNSNF